VLAARHSVNASRSAGNIRISRCAVLVFVPRTVSPNPATHLPEHCGSGLGAACRRCGSGSSCERPPRDPSCAPGFADVFINGEPVVSAPLDFAEGVPKEPTQDPGDLDDVQKFLEQSPRAHAMKPEDRLAEGEVQVILVGKRTKPPKRPT
jgi:hypothetical protein